MLFGETLVFKRWRIIIRRTLPAKLIICGRDFSIGKMGLGIEKIIMRMEVVGDGRNIG